MSTPLILQSQLTCPECGHAFIETMPVDACVHYYVCANCDVLMAPRQGDCCVFCSYGSTPCPPIQAQRPCCAHSD